MSVVCLAVLAAAEMCTAEEAAAAADFAVN